MNTQNEKVKKSYAIINYIFGLLGFLGVILAILTVTNVVEWYLVLINYSGKFGPQNKLILSLTSSILGIFFLFIAFSKQIDKFFNFLETHSIKSKKSEDSKGITIESIFFFVIALILVTLAIMLGIGFLTLKTAILGPATDKILIGLLVLLSIVALITSFNNIISQSLKKKCS